MDKETLSHYGWIVVMVIILMCLLFFATPFGTFVADGVKVTLDGYIATNNKALDEEHMNNIVQEWENKFLDSETPQKGENTPGATFTENPDGTVDGVLPPTNGPDTPVEIPEKELPTIIDFTFGEFDSTTTYTPGKYATVEYQEDITTVKYPASAQGFLWSKWQITKDSNDNIISVVPYEIELADIDTKYSTYIAYDFNTKEHLTYEGVAGDSVQLYTIYNESDDTLDNIIYLAAYYQKATGADLHIAQWNGTCYVAVDYDAKVDAVNTFTTTTTVTKTKSVLVSIPSANTTYAYVPVGTLKAEAGMTWAEWLESDYNTTGETFIIIKTADFEDVSYDDAIVAGESYGFMFVSPILKENDWQTIATVIRSGKIAKAGWQVGDLTPAFAINGNTKQARIVDIDGNKVTFMLTSSIGKHIMSPYGIEFDGIYSYADSEMRTWLDTTVYNSLDADLKAVISPTSVTCADISDNTGGTKDVTCHLFLPSVNEVNMMWHDSVKDNRYTASFEAEGETFDWFTEYDEFGYLNYIYDDFWLRTPDTVGFYFSAVSQPVETTAASNYAVYPVFVID